LLPVVVSRLSAMLYRRFKLSQEHYALLSARTQENIAGIKVIKSFTQEENEINTFSGLNREYINKNLALARVRSIFWPMMILVGGIGSLVVLWVGGMQVINGTLTIGQFVQFSAYIIAITWPLISLGWVINLIQRGEVSMGRLNKILKMQPEIKSSQRPCKITTLKGDIFFKDVYFKYPKLASYELYQEETVTIRQKKEYTKNGFNEKVTLGPGEPLPSDLKYKKAAERWILKKIDLKVESGMQLGIAGFTGSGKSTLVNLIPRLYDPQKGCIFIDGIDIKKIPLDILRSGIAYVTQDPFIFSKSIRENVIFGKEEDLSKFTEARRNEMIMSACRASHLDEDIQTFPRGYDTMVGERGITLSGGQKQRLAIARALITEPAILILDDSFSSIDTNTEAMILGDLKTITKNLTTIIISHRISTIKDSDLIVVMDDGQIAETGNHRQLLKKCGIYQRLHARQQLSEELEEEI
ncbi:MAG: ABC transporter ATP-binding protein, partial [Actinobacteria bacterium]|nr:ABC transporter ATP-binding protein [Actinomycetota bacterium]